MSFYHPTRGEAEKAGDPYREYWEVRAELEPDNGWVLILSPKTKEVFNWPLAGLLEVAEIDLTRWPRVAKKPREYKKFIPTEAVKKPVSKPVAPPPPPPPPVSK